MPFLSVNVPVTAGEELKIDYAVHIQAAVLANFTMVAQIRLRRSGTLINTLILQRNLANAGLEIFPLANTFIDTAPSTTTNTYSLSAIVTYANQVVSSEVFLADINVVPSA